MPRASSRWSWIGGRPALDFVNTRRRRWDEGGVETLAVPDDLGEWLVEARLLPEPMRVPRRVLGEARELREAIDAAVQAAVAGKAPAAGAIELIDDWLVHAGTRPALTMGPHGQPVLGERPAADSPRRALGTLALDAATLLGADAQRARLRICAGEGCSARFYDRSPAGGRRWCSMRTCGNLAKARRHRERQRAEARA